MSPTSLIISRDLDRVSLAHLQCWKSDPKLFVRSRISGVELEPWQERVLDDIGAGKTRLTIRSGHGVGKTALLAWIVLWFMCTHYPCKVGCTAPTTHAIADVLWPEIGLWLGRRDEPLRSQFRFSHLGLALA